MDGFTLRHVPASDGLLLAVRDYSAQDLPSARLPVVCLPGLTRNGSDFHDLALHLNGRGHRVIALDARGRGLSAWASDPASYTLETELGDLLTVLAMLGIGRAILVGTSRGGILTAAAATSAGAAAAAGVAFPPAGLVAGAVLNDVGPVIERAGLLRIKRYVGASRSFASLETAAAASAAAAEGTFPGYGLADWLRVTARVMAPSPGGGVVPLYDPGLTLTLSAIAPDIEVPPLWPLFAALMPLPLMMIRGASSDLLSAGTVAAMTAAKPDLTAWEAPGEGHAPDLAGADAIEKVAAFCASLGA
jgi:pimeloyl-ACP methyl ester carboxylesterase